MNDSTRRNRNGPIAAVLMGVLLFSSAHAQQRPPALERAQIGFAATVQDREIVQLLQQNGVSGRAAFAWSMGLSGSHRTNEDLSAPEFLAQARAKSIEFLEAALKANAVRLGKFQEKHGGDEVTQSESLQQEARSLLNIRRQIEGALKTARAGDPLFFAMEVEGTREKLERLRTNGAVRAFSRADAGDRKSAMARVRTIKPAAYRGEYRDPAVMTISPTDLYDRVLKSTAATAPSQTEGVRK